MMLTINRAPTYVLIATFHSLPAATAFFEELQAKPEEDGIMALRRDGTTVVWRLDNPEPGRAWGKEFEARWMKQLEEERQ